MIAADTRPLPDRAAYHRALHPAVILLVLWAVSLAPRLACVRLVQPELDNDEQAYYEIAINYLERGQYRSDRDLMFYGFEQVRAPLVPWILLGLFKAIGPHILPSRLVFCVLSSLIVFPLYRIARHLGVTGRQAWIASAAASLHPYLVLNASRLLTESLFATLIAAAFAGLFGGRGKQPARAAVLAGVWLGLATLCRPTPIPLLPALPLIWLFFPGGSRRWFGAVAATVAVLTLAPWVLSLHARHGVWIPVTTAGSYNLWNANNAYMTPDVMATPIPDMLKQQLLPLPEKDRIAFLRREAQRWIQENRRAFWRSRRLQFARFWKVFPEDFWNRRVSFQEGYETVRSPNQFLISAGKVFWFAGLNILLLASIVESIRQLRRRTPEILAVAACLAAATLVHTVMTGYARYRYPFDPLWMIIGITGALHAVSLFLGPGKTPAVERRPNDSSAP